MYQNAIILTKFDLKHTPKNEELNLMNLSIHDFYSKDLKIFQKADSIIYVDEIGRIKKILKDRDGRLTHEVLEMVSKDKQNTSAINRFYVTSENVNYVLTRKGKKVK